MDESITLYNEGINVNNNRIAVTIREFSLDTPARSLMKGIIIFSFVCIENSISLYQIISFIGIAGHNSKDGCSKCTVRGEFNQISHTVVFPKLDAPKRTDADFRNKMYFGGHQKELTPLLDIPNLDMIQDFPIGDSMHLLDHGITSRLLNGFINGKLSNVDAKWSNFQMNLVSKYLNSIRAPAEIRSQRQIRDLTTIAKWKAIDFRNFALYTGIVILNGNVKDYIYKHFLLYFCALTIITSECHLKRLGNVAELCLNLFVERFKTIYGEHQFTSNVHNLIHLMDDVKRFGTITTFSTYPFESYLFKIKRLLRSGNLPLSQVAKRILEMEGIQTECNNHRYKFNVTLIKCCSLKLDHLDSIYSKKYDLYSVVEFPKFKVYCDRDEDRWLLTKDNHILEVKYIVSCDGNSKLYGQTLNDVEDFFDLPFKSSKMFIFCSKNLRKNPFQLYDIQVVRCKLFKIKLDKNFVFYNDDDDDNEHYNCISRYVFLPIHSTLG